MEFLKSVCFAKNFFNLAQETVKRREVERWQNKRNFWLFFANRWIISIIYLKMEETGDKWNGGEPFHYNLSMNKFEYKKNRDTDSSVSFGRLLFSIFHFFFSFFFCLISFQFLNLLLNGDLLISNLFIFRHFAQFYFKSFIKEKNVKTTILTTTCSRGKLWVVL